MNSTPYTKKLILLDFDGTLVNSLDIAIELYNKYSPAVGSLPIDREEFRDMGGTTTTEMIKRKKLTWWKAIYLVLLIRRKIYAKRSQMEVCPGWQDTLYELKRRGYRIAILTTNSGARVRKYLKSFGISEYFEFVESQKFIFRKHASIAKILRKVGLDKTDIIYIGDESRDVEACIRAGIDFIGVTWGYNNERVLRAAGADRVVEKPGELSGYFHPLS